jgi:hypothetical protein
VDYSVKFIGHVKTQRPKGWPATIENTSVYRAVGTDDKKELYEYLSAMGEKIKMEQGIYASLDLPGQEQSMDDFGNGKFVPMHMFTHVSFSVRRLSGMVPDIENEGVFN